MGKQGGGGDKKQQLYEAIVSQKLQSVRWGVANAGVAPATRERAPRKEMRWSWSTS